MFPIFARTAFGFVYTFTVIWAIGLSAFLWWLYREHREKDLSVALWLGIAFIIGGRIGFVLLNRPYFAEHPRELWRFDLGGLSYWGGMTLLLSVTSLLWVLRSRWRSSAKMIWGLGLPYAHFLGWAACWADGCAYGRPIRLAWYSAVSPDNFGVEAVRLQTQLGGILVFALVTGVLWWAYYQRRPLNSGWIAAVTIGIQTMITLGRGDPWPVLAEVRLDVWLGLVTVLIIGGMGLLSKRALGLENDQRV